MLMVPKITTKSPAICLELWKRSCQNSVALLNCEINTLKPFQTLCKKFQRVNERVVLRTTFPCDVVIF